MQNCQIYFFIIPQRNCNENYKKALNSEKYHKKLKKFFLLII